MDRLSMLDLIKSRRSIKAYQDKPVPKELVEQILEAGRYAPSALNIQPWEFAVITDKTIIQELSSAIKKTIKKLYPLIPILRFFIGELKDERFAAAFRKSLKDEGETVFYNAPVVIFIVSKTGWDSTAVDCSLAAQNMMLQAHSSGIGSCFIGRAELLPKKLFKKIGLSKKHRIYATLIFGYPKETAKFVPERKRDNIICWL